MSLTNALRSTLRRLVPSAAFDARTAWKAFGLHDRERRLRSVHGEETTISIAGDWTACAESAILFQALVHAIKDEGKLPREILDIDGMSGGRYRLLINHVIAALPDARYLEIGSWAGSTACSAMFGNPLVITCIDNWSEFGGPKAAFLDNVKRAQNASTTFRFIEADFRQVDYGTIGRFNVYLFDGPHSEQDQYDGIRLAQPALDDLFTLIVDDWNWAPVRIGTLRGLADEKIEQLFTVEIRSTQDNTHPRRAAGKHSEWHNGYCMCVCRKAAG
jgi:hypothetical protein